MECAGFTVWFTGLSASGKSTIAGLVAEEVRRRGVRVELLAGSEFRQNISQGLGFSRSDRIANVRRIGYVARLLTRNGIAVITTSISPYRESRDECRRMLDSFIEVFVECPLDVCEARDPKGLYRRARAGEIPDFTGIGDSYEAPLQPEIVCHTANEGAAACAERVIAWLEREGWIAPASRAPADADAELIRSRLRTLGDI